MKIKICGLVEKEEVVMLDQLGIDYAGIWFGIPEGKYNLADQQAQAILRTKTKRLQLVPVTLKNKFEEIDPVICDSEAAGIQLHGFQLPALVKKIKDTYGNKLKVMKVLHIKNNECLETDMIARYEDAGTDYYILDTYVSRKEIGSTGQCIEEKFLEAFLPVVSNNKAIIAGGISERNIQRISEKASPHGVDIDSSVRVNDRISYSKVETLLAVLASASFDQTVKRTSGRRQSSYLPASTVSNL